MLSVQYLKLKTPIDGVTHIKISVSFNKDTYHWATGSTKEKGYQVNVTPIEKGDRFESFTAFSGFYEIILPVQRQSKKRLETAISMVQDKLDVYKKHFENQGFEF